TATVTDTDTGTPSTPTGTVSFSSSGAGTFSSSSCTLSGAGSTASCSVSYTPTASGMQTITATYGGDTIHTGSSGTTTVTVNMHETSTAVSCTPASVPVGSPSSCTATVTDSTPTSASAPSGTVSFTEDLASSAFASCTLDGATTNSLTGAVSTSCTVSYTPTPVNPHTITASYSGDASHLSSSGTFVVTALKHETSTAVSCTPASVPVGSPSSCTATVTDSTPFSATAPTGTFTLSLHDALPIFASCTLGGATTNSLTGAVSTSCT